MSGEGVEEPENWLFDTWLKIMIVAMSRC